MEFAAILLVPLLQGQEALRPGLIAEAYSLRGPLEDFPRIPADRKPDLRRIDPQVRIEPSQERLVGSDMADHFYVRWSGILRVPRAGKFTFFLESSDGSRLILGGKTILENGGLHGMEEKSAEVELKAGDQEIEIQFFENVGEFGCRLSWEAEGMAKEIVPARVLFHKRDKDLDKEPESLQR
jgi:hypothetical protein